MRDLSLKIFCLATIVLISAVARGQTNHLAFETYINDNMVKHSVAGVSVALIENNQIAHLYVAGDVNKDTANNVKKDTVFQVGSISMPVAAWAVMRLVQSGNRASLI
jgi:CubicO group peptidase (beta-lactamase class C family)